MVQFQLSSVQTQRQTPRRIAVSLPWFHHPGILVISTSSYMYWPTGAYPQAPRCAHKMVDGVPDWEKRFTNSKLITEFYCNKKKNLPLRAKRVEKTRYLLTSITWPYHGLKFRAHRDHLSFWKLTADMCCFVVLDHGLMSCHVMSGPGCSKEATNEWIHLSLTVILP